MMFILICLIIVSLFVWFLMKSSQCRYGISVGMGLLIILSIVANISLSQNYAASLIPSDEGLGISNDIAYLIIGEDHWTVQVFQAYYEISSYITLILLFLMMLSIALEAKRRLLT